jgi:hypothetical protein
MKFECCSFLLVFFSQEKNQAERLIEFGEVNFRLKEKGFVFPKIIEVRENAKFIFSIRNFNLEKYVISFPLLFSISERTSKITMPKEKRLIDKQFS